MSVDIDDKLAFTVLSLAPLAVGELADRQIHHNVGPLPRPGKEQVS